MKRYILTGTPGCGKTVLLRELQHRGYDVIEEAATDVIALQQAQGIPEPWTDISFIDAVVALQRLRQLSADGEGETAQFFDRSPFCTVALARYLGFAQTSALNAEIERLVKKNIYDKKVFFVEGLGFIQHTAARRISMDEAKRFEEVHLQVYREYGFELIPIAPAGVVQRADQLLANAT